MSRQREASYALAVLALGFAAWSGVTGSGLTWAQSTAVWVIVAVLAWGVAELRKP